MAPHARWKCSRVHCCLWSFESDALRALCVCVCWVKVVGHIVIVLLNKKLSIVPRTEVRPALFPPQNNFHLLDHTSVTIHPDTHLSTIIAHHYKLTRELIFIFQLFTMGILQKPWTNCNRVGLYLFFYLFLDEQIVDKNDHSPSIRSR